MTTHVEVRTGVYYDSVTLLAVSRDVTASDGVDEVVVAMATDLNLGVLADLGFDPAATSAATPNDLVIAVRLDGDGDVAAVIASVDRALTSTAPSADDATTPAPRTVGSAAHVAAADLALISVPGEHAFVEAIDALRAGLHVMVFSDNVPVAQEVVLKRLGVARGLLVMGPDCGTAIVAGVGLGFANAVRPGPVGIVAASGTGAQHLCCLLDDADVGVRHVLGVGGRDLSAAVGGRSTLQALAALDADPAVAVIVVVSKPADPEVAAAVAAASERCATPVVIGLVGRDAPDLTAVATDVVARLGRSLRPGRWRPPQPPGPRRGTLRGLFSGGTLCDEAMVIASAALGPVRSNIPLDPDWTLDADGETDGHVMIDFGDDDLTRGRPHPMIDHTVRLERLAREATRPGDHTVLLDVVLGHGADHDPAATLAGPIADARATADARGDRLAVVVSLCGTRDDAQDRDRQADALAAAGAEVFASNAAAARAAVDLVSERSS